MKVSLLTSEVSSKRVDGALDQFFFFFINIHMEIMHLQC